MSAHRRLLLFPVLALFAASFANSQETANEKDRPPPTITVTGNSETFAPPDQATVRLGAESQAGEAAPAQDTVNTAIRDAIAAIKKTGVPESSIRTLGLHLAPVYAPAKPGRETEPPRVVAYRASNTLQVTVDDLKLVGRVIDAGLAAGANRLQGVTFELKDELPHRRRALRQAAEEAKTKAETIAAALGVKLSSVYEATEGGVQIMPRHTDYMLAERAVATASPTPVQPGELRVHASVTARFEIMQGSGRERAQANQ